MAMTKPEHQRLTTVIKDTVRLLVKNSVQFTNQLTIQGLLAVCLDQQEIFVVHLDERIGDGEDTCHTCGQSKATVSSSTPETHLLVNSQPVRGRTRSWSESACPIDISDDEATDYDDDEDADLPPPAKKMMSSEEMANDLTAMDVKAHQEAIMQSVMNPPNIIIKRDRGDYKLHEDLVHWSSVSGKAVWKEKEPGSQELSSWMKGSSAHSSTSASLIESKSPIPRSEPSTTSSACDSVSLTLASSSDRGPLLPISDILPTRKQDPTQEELDSTLHECRYCSYKSPYKGTLNRHMRVHQSEKPFKCPFCDYSSRFRSNLLQHCAHLHPGGTGSSKAEPDPT